MPRFELYINYTVYYILAVEDVNPVVVGRKGKSVAGLALAFLELVVTLSLVGRGQHCYAVMHPRTHQ